jgi:8-oxo-dGTP diphosphatase
MKIETSAGGVVYKRSLRPSGLRKSKGKIEFLVVQHSGHHRWVLPKGWIDPGETKEQAAVREVKEEAGVEAEIINYLGEFTIFYTSPEKEKVRKTSHFFLMKHKSGDPSKELGWEMKDFVWLPEKEAIEKLDYPGEKKMVEKALKKLNLP